MNLHDISLLWARGWCDKYWWKAQSRSRVELSIWNYEFTFCNTSNKVWKVLNFTFCRKIKLIIKQAAGKCSLGSIAVILLSNFADTALSRKTNETFSFWGLQHLFSFIWFFICCHFHQAKNESSRQN